jgi:hypothetical protein
MKIVDDDGAPLITEFSVEPFTGATSVVIASASGGESRHYAIAWRLLLTRLARLEAIVTDAFVDSRHTRGLGLSRDDVRLVLRGPRPYPLHLATEPDLDELRRAFGAAQEHIGQQATAKGGNRNKRIRLLIAPGAGPFPADLAGYLSGGDATPPEIEDVLNASEAAAGRIPHRQGFMQSADARRAVELRGMAVARDALEARGYTAFDDVSLTESYDFRCLLGETEVHVEVKGTTSSGERILLTRNEVAHARDWHPDVVLVVVHGIALDDEAVATGGTANVIEGWAPRDAELEPLSYQCIVPTI